MKLFESDADISDFEDDNTIKDEEEEAHLYANAGVVNEELCNNPLFPILTPLPEHKSNLSLHCP